MDQPCVLRNRGNGRWLRRTLCHGLALLVCLGSAGCTRRYFRRDADKEVNETLAQKDIYPEWKIEQFHDYPDPRARFADPTNPDRPPMPPDDPAAHDLSPNPQHPPKAGIALVEGRGYLDLLARWDEENRAEAAQEQRSNQPAASPLVEEKETLTQSPGKVRAPEQLPAPTPTGPAGSKPQEPSKPAPQGDAAAARSTTAEKRPSETTSLATPEKPGERPPYLIKLEQAVELGLINSREYQAAREDLYLTALPVTLQRFAFAPQLFAVGQAMRVWAGRQTPSGHQNNWTLSSNLGVAKLFSTGALLLMNFANQTVFNFTGVGPHTTSVSTIDLSVIQPLLQGGGFAVTLEPLTQVERNLLYGIRNFARFRKVFYVSIAGGGGGSITGSSFQPTNVIAFASFTPGQGIGGSGLIPGVIPAVPITGNRGLQVGPGTSGLDSLQVPLTAPVSGYLTTLLQAAQMRVDEYNIEKLQGYVDLARSMLEGGDVSQLQVDQFEQQLLVRRTTLLTDQLQYLQSLEQFKLQLGVPLNLRIELDDSPFRPLNRMFQRYEELFKQFEAVEKAALPFSAPDLVARLRPELLRIMTTAPIVQGTTFRTTIAAKWAAWEKLTPAQIQNRLAQLGEERRRLEDLKAERETKHQPFSAAEQARLDEISFEFDLGVLEKELRDYESEPWKRGAESEARRRREQQARFRSVVDKFLVVIVPARNERVYQLRSAWPDLARLCVDGSDLLKVDLEEAEAKVVQHALANRLDLMNVRGQLVDAWRQLRIFANALLGAFNVQYHLNTFTPPNTAQPFNFSSSRTTQQLILSGELPLVRKSQRNAYRATLINYQRARRILQSAEDEVAFSVRNEIILLRQQEENYRIQQRLVELSYLTVENSLDTFRAPPTPTPAGQLTDIATRAAALASQLITAQTSLYNAQFAMTTIWITYMNTRLTLYRDMELMPLDLRGVWIDDVAKCECPDSANAGRARLGFAECDAPVPAQERGSR